MPRFETWLTEPMRRLAIIHAFLRHVGESQRSDGLKFVALLPCFPVFELHNFLFKLAYRLGSFRLRRQCRAQRRLGIKNTLTELQLDILDRQAIGNSLHALYEVERTLKSANCSTNFSDANHF